MKWTEWGLAKSQKFTQEHYKEIESGTYLQVIRMYNTDNSDKFSTNTESLIHIPEECKKELEESGKTSFILTEYKIFEISEE